MQHSRSFRATSTRVVVVASVLLMILSVDRINFSNAIPIQSNQDLATDAQAIDPRSILFPLQKRALPIELPTDIVPPSPTDPPPTSSEPPVTTATTTNNPVTSTTTTIPPVITTTISITTTTPPPATSKTTTSTSETTTSSSRTSKTTSKRPGGPADPTGPTNKPTSTATSNSTTPPTPTPSNSDESSKVPLLPIILGSVLGFGALVGAGVFFFLRFRKNRRFDSKRPLSFLALSLEDPTGGPDSGSSRASGSEAIYDSNRPITSQPSLRYTPPVMSGIRGNSRASFHSSEISGATTGQYAQWSQDDENSALVGGPTRQQQIMIADQAEGGYPARFSGGVYSQEQSLGSEQSFVASSMLPLAPNDPNAGRYSRQQQQTAAVQQETVVAKHAGNPQLINSQENVPLQTLNAGSGSPVQQRPLSVHSVASPHLSIRNLDQVPSGQSGHQQSVRSVRSSAGNPQNVGANTTNAQDHGEDELQYL
ncbi:hypothetical protein BGX27_009864 [Mortierella sp. AM989]|nr:hypothetical protein BGX27_009864 [Mortierella sp. AM989]